MEKIPYCSDIYKQNISEIDESSLDRIVIVNSTIIRVGTRHSLEKQKLFKCSECQAQYLCIADPETYNKLEIPYKCSNSIAKTKKNNMITVLFEQMKKKKENTGNSDKNEKGKFFQKDKKSLQSCNNKKFEPVENSQLWVDYQEIKIQETFRTIKPGCIPKTMSVILEGAFVDRFKPGDDIILTGILIKRWKKIVNETRPDITMCILANEILLKNCEKTKENLAFLKESQNLLTFEEEFELNWLENQGNLPQELQYRNDIIQSICPQIYGKFDIKLAILLTIIGGVTRTINNTRVRGQCHLLLIGEPGTGKSQMLKFVQKLSNRAVFTNGIGSSSAGLTVSFVREGSEWMIEAGALVLSDMGVCCIDEFNLIKAGDYVAIHEAMEQQTISAAKAGLTVKVNARTTIIAACNPVTNGQRYNPEANLSQNTALSTPLISRFDLIFVIIDQVNAGIDQKNCDFILGKFEGKREEERQVNQSWDCDKLKKYVKVIQQKFEPNLCEKAQKLLTQYYYNHLRKIEVQGFERI